MEKNIEYILEGEMNTVITTPERVDIITPKGRILYRQFQIGREPYTEIVPENLRYLYERNVKYFVLEDFNECFREASLRRASSLKVEHNVDKSRLHEIIQECKTKFVRDVVSKDA